MNPLISPASSIHSPLNQLNTHCNRLLNSLHDGRGSQKERILFEQTLWNEVKKIRALNDATIFNYLIGFYHTTLYRVSKSPSASSQNDLFHYHVLIRLGDLNRYLERNDIAEYYYCNARNLFPYFGHAYNQLGLLTKPSDYYKCCYYYARAARSNDKSLGSIAENNLRIALSKCSCQLLGNVLNGESSFDVSDDEVNECGQPVTAFEWFYLIVVSIHADNIQPIAKAFLSFMNENFSTQRSSIRSDNIQATSVFCDLESYVLLASLDIVLDWLRLGSQGKVTCETIGSELRQIRSSLLRIISLCQESFEHLNVSGSSHNSSGTLLDANSSSTSGNSSSLLNCSSNSGLTDSLRSSDDSGFKNLALPHDYVLRGFGPLNVVHQELSFEKEFYFRQEIELSPTCGNGAQMFIHAEQLVRIATRIRSKLDALKPYVKRQTRNIALESILSNMSRD